jgi:oxaloacetate decarboxylase gamma subunit
MDTSIGELLLSGAKLMVFGMGTVYLFLALLVWVIGLNSKLIQRFSTGQTTQGHHPAHPVTAAVSAEEDDAELVAAISAAIHHHQHK